MTTDINAWLAERERLAKAATPGPWTIEEDTADGKDEAWCHWHRVGPFSLMGEKANANDYHIAAWSPAQVERVLAVVRCADYALRANLPIGGGDDCEECSYWLDLRAALAALAGGERG